MKRLTFALAIALPLAGAASFVPVLPSAFVLRSQEPPLPASEEFVQQVRDNLARADREQYRYAYHERRSDLHTNPFGKLGTSGTLLYAVHPGDEYGIYHRQLIARDGQTVTDEKQQTVDRRGRSETNPAVEDVVQTLDFSMVRREVVGGRDMIVVSFSPKPDAKPRTRQGKMAKAFEGTTWIDEALREVVRLEATSVDTISYGLGVIARLGKGAKVELVRERIDESIWLPTSIRLKGEGRAILVRKLKIDYFIQWFDYRRALG